MSSWKIKLTPIQLHEKLQRDNLHKKKTQRKKNVYTVKVDRNLQWKFCATFFFVIYFSAFLLTFLWITINAQQFPYQSPDDNQKGVCTINGKVYYGIDCWCYTGGLGSTLVSLTFVVLIIFFLISGCIWGCIFSFCKCIINRNKDDDFDGGLPSLRQSMRSSMRRPVRETGPDTQI